MLAVSRVDVLIEAVAQLGICIIEVANFLAMRGVWMKADFLADEITESVFFNWRRRISHVLVCYWEERERGMVCV